MQMEIQHQIDETAAAGGGTVKFPPGIVLLSNALRLRSKVRLVGSAGTVLRRIPSVASRLVDRVGYGHYEFTVEDPDLFPVGSGVHVYDDLAWGFYTTVATVIGRRGDLIFIDRPFAHDYGPGANGTVVRISSIVDGTDIHDAALLDIELDGNTDETRLLDGCRGAGIFLLRAHRILIDNVNIGHFHGDGISFQACTDVVIRDSNLHHNSGIGVHPGSGSVRYVIANNHVHDNGSHGIFYCLRSSHSDCRANRIERNGDSGISVGERDTHHLIRDNTIVENGSAGIEFRTFVRRGGDFVRTEGNTIGPNCMTKGDCELMIAKGHYHLHFARNHLSHAIGKKIVQIEAGCDAIHFVENSVAGAPMTAADMITTGSEVSFANPREPLAVGPAALDPDGARHLNVESLPSWSPPLETRKRKNEASSRG